MPHRRGRHRMLPTVATVALLLVACDAPSLSTSSPPGADASRTAVATMSAAPASPAIEAAPGSESTVYAPNPAAIVVAVEAGHGGCLDWGVADPSERGPEFAEKAITLAIAERLRDALEAQGITVVMVREGDEALAGDEYPALGCNGAPFRDVNGDGIAGFGPDVPVATRTRDELQARLDLANVTRADAFISIHVDSIADEAGNLLPIARTETFYTDETSWGTSASRPLAAGIQTSLVAAMAEVASYDREDRGSRAHNLYVVAPPLFEPTAERPDPKRQPTRGALMPAVLVEVGSITLPAEHDLLLADTGQGAAAEGLLAGLSAYFGSRELAARIELVDTARGARPQPRAGSGPPFWAPSVALGPDEVIGMRLRLVNTGIAAWPTGLRLLAGVEASDEPYLRQAPDLASQDVAVPPIAPGESVELDVSPTPPGAPAGERQIVWLTLADGARPLAELGSPPLQVAIEPD